MLNKAIIVISGLAIMTGMFLYQPAFVILGFLGLVGIVFFEDKGDL